MSKLHKAKEKYYKFKIDANNMFGGLTSEVNNYVGELEKSNAEMLEALIEVYRYNNHWGTGNYHTWNHSLEVLIKDIIEKAMDQKIEEVIK